MGNLPRNYRASESFGSGAPLPSFYAFYLHSCVHHQVGWVNPARFTWAEWMGKAIKFKPATFYLDVTDFIARNVEDQDEEEGRTNEMDTHVDATDARSNEVPSAASEEEAGGTNDRESTSSDGTKSGDSTTI
jgi:hypothetical protein